MKTVFTTLILLTISFLNAQTNFTGKQYIGEGLPLRWFYLSTDSSGIYYSKGCFGQTELISNPIKWKQTDTNSIQLTIYNNYSTVKFEFIKNNKKDYLLDTINFEVFHRRISIEHESIIYKE